MTPILAPLFVVYPGRLQVVCVAAGGLERLLRVDEPGDVVGENAFVIGHLWMRSRTLAD